MAGRMEARDKGEAKELFKIQKITSLKIKTTESRVGSRIRKTQLQMMRHKLPQSLLV